VDAWDDFFEERILARKIMIGVTMEQLKPRGEKQPKIRRGRVDSILLYEITDQELDLLATGLPSSIFLNFAIFLLSVAMSFLIALLTATILSLRIYNVFVILVVVGFISGFILLCLWYRNRIPTARIVKKIKKRIQALSVAP